MSSWLSDITSLEKVWKDISPKKKININENAVDGKKYERLINIESHFRTTEIMLFSFRFAYLINLTTFSIFSLNVLRRKINSHTIFVCIFGVVWWGSSIDYKLTSFFMRELRRLESIVKRQFLHHSHTFCWTKERSHSFNPRNEWIFIRFLGFLCVVHIGAMRKLENSHKILPVLYRNCSEGKITLIRNINNKKIYFSSLCVPRFSFTQQQTTQKNLI